MTSSFRGKGKKSAWLTWKVFDEVTPTFKALSTYPVAINEANLQSLERFVVLVYDRSSPLKAVNEARLEMFARKQKMYDTIPPTQDALYQHIRRSAYQAAAAVWGQCFSTNPNLPCPADW